MKKSLEDLKNDLAAVDATAEAEKGFDPRQNVLIPQSKDTKPEEIAAFDEPYRRNYEKHFHRCVRCLKHERRQVKQCTLCHGADFQTVGTMFKAFGINLPLDVMRESLSNAWSPAELNKIVAGTYPGLDSAELRAWALQVLEWMGA